MRLETGAGKAAKPREGFIPNPKWKLLDQISEVMRLKWYWLGAERTCREWGTRFIFFQGKRHPREMGAFEVGGFLRDLATTRKPAASTRNQGFNALLFLYRGVLHRDLGELGQVERGQRPNRLPTVFTKAGVEAVLAGMSGTRRLMAKVLYGRSEPWRSCWGMPAC